MARGGTTCSYRVRKCCPASAKPAARALYEARVTCPAARLFPQSTKHTITLQWPLLERFLIDCRKTKTRAITPTNHNGNKELHEPITIPSNYL